MNSTTVANLGEHALIERIRNRVPPVSSDVLIGIGDDAAVIKPDRGTVTVVTTDGLVEGTHFDRAFCSAPDIGHRALAVNLSDLAAMGAMPRQVLLSLVLPPKTLLFYLDQMIDTFLALAARHRTTLIGGNITASASTGPLFVEVTAIGSAKRRGVLTRDGAQPGDIIYGSGSIGGAAAGLASLRRIETDKQLPANDQASYPSSMDACQQKYLRPSPRVRLGVALGRNRAARACIDLSDGFGNAVHQLVTASNVGARIKADALPVHHEASCWFKSAGTDPLIEAICGGDDYELMFTAPQSYSGRLAHVKRQVGNLAITPVGVVTKERDIVLSRTGIDVPVPHGFTHFRQSHV